MTDTSLTFDGVTEQKVSDFLLFKDEALKGTEYQGTIEFDNGFALSIVRHESSYGGKNGLFEIMLCKGGTDGSPTCLPPITEEGDTIKGFLTEEKVKEIIELTGDLPAF